ncbi:MAG: HAD-superfamily hydrolase, subfamily variant 3 [Verrucomicrobia bacterium]|nr:HAD-superfamily hydrolase, subfamily variant 3 [Verrucomicrobiota bacterium]
MTRFATLLIDLDGTLVDAFTTIHRGYVHTLPQFGRPAPAMDEVRRAVGGGIANAMGHFLPPDLIPAAIKVHTDYVQTILLDDVTLMPGGREFVRSQHERGRQLAVFTNKQAEAARRICAHLEVTPFLDGVFGAGDTPWLKPQPEFTEYVLAKLGAQAGSALLIGDSPFDVATARNAGFPAWCVTTGTHAESELRSAGADEVFPNLAALGGELK